MAPAATSRPAAPSVREFFTELHAGKHLFPLLKHLARGSTRDRDAARYLVYTDPETAAVLAQQRSLKVPITTDADRARELRGSANVVIAVSAYREPELLRELKGLFPRSESPLLLGFLRDVYPFIQSRSSMLSVFDVNAWDLEAIRRLRRRPAKQIADVPSYCIVCTPRSGSHFLCDLLASSGFGQPKEHTKGPFAFLAAHAADFEFSLTHWHRIMRAYAQDAGMLGSKVVGHDLFRICEHKPDFLRLYDRIIYLYRRDKVMQTISMIRARQKGVWHLRPETGTRYAAIDYDAERMLASYGRLMRQEEKTRALIVESARPVLLLEYESLAADPAGAIAQVAAFLDHPAAGTPHSAEQVIRRAADETLAARLVREAARRELSLTREFRPEVPGAES